MLHFTGHISYTYINTNIYFYLQGCVLRAVEGEGVRVRVPDEADVVVLQSWHRRQVPGVLRCRAAQWHRWVGDWGAARRGVPREVSWGRLLENRLGGAKALGVRRGVHLAQVVRGVGQSTGRAEDGLCHDAGLGLQEGEDPRVFCVFGLHPLHRSEVVNQVLHAFVVAVMKIIGKLCQELPCK